MRSGSKRALILRLGAIGDIITVVPAARALHDAGFEVHWVCGNAARPLLQCYPWVHVIPLNDAAALTGSFGQRLRHIVGLWRRIAVRRWDLSAILYFDRRYRILTLPVRAARHVALSSRDRKTNLIAVRSYSDEFARILLDREDGCRPQGLAPLRPETLPPSPLPPAPSRRRIALVPGGASNLISQQILRRWPVENYVTLAAELRKRGWEVVLLGGPDDAWVRPSFQNLDVTDWIGRASLPEVISLCDTCDAVISHDTGPMHLAGLSHAALIAIFGPSNPGHVLPRRPGVVGIWGGQTFACRPCYDLRSYAQCQSPECIRQVSPQLVLAELDRLLEARTRGVAEPWRVVSL